MGVSTSEIQAADAGDDLAAWEEREAQEARDRHQQMNARWGEVWTWRVCHAQQLPACLALLEQNALRNGGHLLSTCMLILLTVPNRLHKPHMCSTSEITYACQHR